MENEILENDVILEGYLKKWTGYLTGWRERYFTLKEGGILTFLDKQTGKDKGTIYLKIGSIKLTPKDPLRITIHSGLKELNLRAGSIIDKYRWVSALREAAYSTQDSASTNRSPHSKRKPSQGSLNNLNNSGQDSHLNASFKKISDFENQMLAIIAFLLDKSLPKDCEVQVVKLNTVFRDMMKAVFEWKEALSVENERLERMKEKLDNYFDGLDGVRVNVDDGLIKPEQPAIRPVKSENVQTDSLGESSVVSERHHSDAPQTIQTSDKILSIQEAGEKRMDFHIGKELSPIPDVENEEYQNVALQKKPSQNQFLSPVKHDTSPREEQIHTDRSRRSIASPELKINGRSVNLEEEKEYKAAAPVPVAEKRMATLGVNDVTEDEEQFYSIVNPQVSKIVRAVNNERTINNDRTVEGGTMFQTVNEDDMQSFAQEEEVKFQNLDNPDVQVLQYLSVPNLGGDETRRPKTAHPHIESLLRDNPVYRDYIIPYASKRNSFPFDIEPISEKSWTWTEKKNGLDVPISFHEPLSFLQRLCEQYEYAEILDNADNIDDSLLRMAHVIAFTISGYHTTSRRLTKPMDSLLGETFEFCPEDSDFQFIAEQTSLLPPVTSFFGSSKHFESSGTIGLKPEFLGKCIEVKAEGNSQIKLKKSGDVYIYSRPITSVDNVKSGKYCISNYGEMRFKNTKTQESATVNLVKRGRDESKIHVLEGYIKDAKGESVYKVTGKWDEEISIENVETKEVTEIWKRKITNNVDTNFGFTHFALQLNYLNKELLYELPPTDSRFRPDIRALENGDYELANTENIRLKEKQEKLVKSLKENNAEFQPKWFDAKKDNKDTEDPSLFNHKYFTEKMQGSYETDLYNEDSQTSINSNSAV